MEYDSGELSDYPEGFHNMGELEYRRQWARVWVDMGTSDELARGGVYAT